MVNENRIQNDSLTAVNSVSLLVHQSFVDPVAKEICISYAVLTKDMQLQ